MMIRLPLFRWAIAASLLLLAGGSVLAQPRPDTSTVESDLEAILDDLDPESSAARQLAELLTELAAHPLDVNSASAAELSQIPALSAALAARIVAHRKTNGPFPSLNDMLDVKGLSPATLQQIRPYLRIGDAESETQSSWRGLVAGLDYEVIQRVTRRLDLDPRYDATRTSSPYLGSPERVYTRIRIRNRHRLSLGLTLDKDPGEPFRWEPGTQTYGYDHVSGHVAVLNQGRFERLIVGDFSAEFGQGLTFWRPTAFGKGRNPVSPLVRSGRGLVPYGSTEENRFLRGAAATFRLHSTVSASAFASRRSLDATLTPAADSTLESTVLVANEPETGLHRTAREIARKDALRETLFGGAIAYHRSALQAGVVAYHSSLSVPIAPDTRPDERFDWTGSTATMLSAYANASLGRYYLFGEIGRSPNGTWGGVGGLSMDVSSHLKALVLGRLYPRDFHSRHGYAFGEQSGATQNEIGLYAGLRLRVSDTWQIAASFDQYQFPWLRYATPRPTAGYDARVVVEHTPRRWLQHYLQFRSETNEAASTLRESPVHLLDAVRPETRQSLRWHGRYTFSDQLRLQSRIELSRFAAPGASVHTGSMLYQDVRWRPVPFLRLDGRIAFFDTEGFDARIYAYENDLLYAFAIPAFSGRGQRRYVMAHLDIGRGLDLQVKYSVTRGADASIASNRSDATGSRLREIRVQVRWTR